MNSIEFHYELLIYVMIANSMYLIVLNGFLYISLDL